MESEWARQGQWGSHLFLPVKCTRPLARLATACLDHYVSSLDEPLVDLDLPSTELHISLSQHFALRSHQVSERVWCTLLLLHALARVHPHSTTDTPTLLYSYTSTLLPLHICRSSHCCGGCPCYWRGRHTPPRPSCCCGGITRCSPSLLPSSMYLVMLSLFSIPPPMQLTPFPTRDSHPSSSLPPNLRIT